MLSNIENNLSTIDDKLFSRIIVESNHKLGSLESYKRCNSCKRCSDGMTCNNSSGTIYRLLRGVTGVSTFTGMEITTLMVGSTLTMVALVGDPSVLITIDNGNLIIFKPYKVTTSKEDFEHILLNEFRPPFNLSLYYEDVVPEFIRKKIGTNYGREAAIALTNVYKSKGGTEEENELNNKLIASVFGRPVTPSTSVPKLSNARLSFEDKVRSYQQLITDSLLSND